MSCPHLKQVVMLFCDAHPVQKMLPLDRIATADPCLGEFRRCPVFREGLASRNAVSASSPPARDAASVPPQEKDQ